MYTEKELDKLNYAQLSDILTGLGAELDSKMSKADIKQKIVELQQEANDNSDEVSSDADSVELLNTDSQNTKIDRVASVILARRESVSTGTDIKEGTLEQKIVARRVLNGNAAAKTIEDAIFERKKLI